jgi:hypothetical protein
MNEPTLWVPDDAGKFDVPAGKPYDAFIVEPGLEEGR